MAFDMGMIKLTNGKEESLPVYIRHFNEHPRKERDYEHTSDDLEYSITILKRIKNV